LPGSMLDKSTSRDAMANTSLVAYSKDWSSDNT
jgi:hypothetical protein